MTWEHQLCDGSNVALDWMCSGEISYEIRSALIQSVKRTAQMNTWDHEQIASLYYW